MQPSNPDRRQVLGDLVVLEDDAGLDTYEQARQAARQAASEICIDPMLLAWRDQEQDRYWPKYECGKGIEPPWIVWASSRGADLTVRIGKRWYFYFLCWRGKG